MKKTILILSAFVLALGLTQCKKEEVPATTNDNIDNGVRITLNVGNSSRANVDPNGNPNWATVSFETGDYIYVGYNNAYVGYLECTSATAETGYGYFEGTVNIETVVSGEKLHFYMLGGKDFQPDPTSISSNQLSVNISDQSSKYPVISCATSNEDYAATTTAYTSDRLMNKVSIMKFNVTTRSSAPICITGMNNKVTLNFDPATPDTDEGFTYGINTEDGGLIKMPAKDANNETWAIVLPQDALTTSGGEGSANTFDYPYYYSSVRPAIHKIESNKYYHENNDVIAMTMNSRVVDLSKLTAHYTAQDGDTLSGILNGESQPYKINVNTDGASITLLDATINGKNDEELCSWAGINCENNATIILEGTNNVTSFHEDYPGIHIASGKTLTIQGSGTLNASSNGYGAGIGSSYNVDCGNIVINSGTINATGGIMMAGIGGGFRKNCGSITINGGNVTATGGRGAAGIGTGMSQVMSITINGGNVTATGGSGAAGIGTGRSQESITCGDISITAGIVNATGGRGAAGIGSGFVTYNGIHNTCGNISITGGQVTATGGDGGDHVYPDIIDNTSWENFTYYGGAGIGTGSTVNRYGSNAGSSSCGYIRITGGQVTATKGGGTYPATNSIGKNESSYNLGTCGTITIGGTVYPDGISDSPYTYP